MSATLASHPQALPFLAFDFGTRRVGVATGNSLTRTATPLTTIESQGQARLEAIAALVAEWRPSALVIGVPFHPDGAAHANTARARRFGHALRQRFGLPVHEVDERYSTTEARSAGARASEARGHGGEARGHGARSPDLDAASAAVILEQHLATLP